MADETKTKPDLIDAKKLILSRMNTGLETDEIDMLATEEAVEELIKFFNTEHEKALNPKKLGEKPTFARIQNSRKKNPVQKIESKSEETKKRYNVEQVWRPNRAWQTEKMKEAADGNAFIIRRHNIRGVYDPWGELI